MGDGIQTDHVHGAVRGARRTANQRPGERIDLIEREAEGLRVVHGRDDRECADAVGDEVWRVESPDHALAERGGQEAFEVIRADALRWRAVAMSSTSCM